MKTKRIIAFICVMLLPLIIGMVSAAISARGMAAYGEMAKPPLSPPAWVFSAAWTILYLMMGLATSLVLTTPGNTRDKFLPLALFALQLIMNFMWSIIFFNGKMYLLAFLWLIILWLLVAACTFRYYGIRSISGYLMIPYLLWLTFAGYLNMGAYILSGK